MATRLKSGSSPHFSRVAVGFALGIFRRGTTPYWGWNPYQGSAVTLRRFLLGALTLHNHRMGYTTAWQRLSPRQLNLAINTFSLISIFFEGYDQGVMGGANAAPTYITTVGIGKLDGTITSTTHEGGIGSVYCLGAIFGCFIGGWLADRIGRINGLLAGPLFALVGGALQAAAQTSNFMICARMVTGIGTGALTGITPVLVAETLSAKHWGAFLGYVFIANYLGISLAYCISFGLAFVNRI